MRYYRVEQSKLLASVLNFEIDANYSRDNIVYAAPGADQTTNYEPGTALGRIALGAVTSAKTGAGNGARSNIALGAAGVIGDYVARYVDATAGRWEVTSPSGAFLGSATNGTLFNHAQIKFQIAQGATVWAVGDTVTFTVAPGDQTVTALDFAATDGSQNFYGVAGAYCVVTGTETQRSFAIARGAVLVAEGIAWPEGATDVQIAGALRQAEARGLLAR